MHFQIYLNHIQHVDKSDTLISRIVLYLVFGILLIILDIKVS